MGKTMLLWILLTTLLPMTTTEVSTLPPPSVQQTTLQPKQDVPETVTDAFNQYETTKTVRTTAEAPKIVTPVQTVTPALVTQKQIVAKLEATTIISTNETSSTATSTPTHRVEANDASTIADFTTTAVQNTESSTPIINSSRSRISSTVSSTSSWNTNSTQTNTMAMETTTVMAQPGRATTRPVATAKLSATTETVSETTTSLQNATDSAASIASAKTTSFISIKSSPSPAIPDVQKSTAKVFTITTGKTTVAKKAGETKEETDKGVKHGKIVAGLIGGALLAMMIGFLVILYKRHKLKKHQIATTDWAGPTPFLDAGGGGDNGHVKLRSASRISLTSFLPQRLSKRLSLLAENGEEEMQDMTLGTTFAAKEREKNGVKLEQKWEVSAKEAEGNDSESSGKTDELVLVDEVKDDEVSKDKINGHALMNDDEKGTLNDNSTESAPKKSENGNTEGDEKGVDDVE